MAGSASRYANAKWLEFFGQILLAKTQFIFFKLNCSRDACPIKALTAISGWKFYEKYSDLPPNFRQNARKAEPYFSSNLLTPTIAWLFGWFNTIIWRFLLIYLLGIYLFFGLNLGTSGLSTFDATCLLFTEIWCSSQTENRKKRKPTKKYYSEES